MNYNPYYGYFVEDFLKNVLSKDEAIDYANSLLVTSGYEFLQEDNCLGEGKVFYGASIHSGDDVEDMLKELEKKEQEITFKDIIIDSINYISCSSEIEDKIKKLKDYDPYPVLAMIYI